MRRIHFLIAGAFLIGALAGALAQGKLGARSLSPSDEQQPGVAKVETEPGSTVEEPNGESASANLLDLVAVAGDAPEATQVGVTDSSELESQVREMSANWARAQGELSRLQGRIAKLETRFDQVSSKPDDGDRGELPKRASTTEERTEALVNAGVTRDVAADLLWRRSQAELERLELQDLAIREGWFGSDRYRDEVQRIEEEAPDLRAELGDDVYDRYLFETGENNRVELTSIISGSAAEGAGLQTGDLIESYGDARVFTFAGLREATSEGERGELIPVQIRRDGNSIQAWLPRGPVGVSLDMTRANPDT